METQRNIIDPELVNLAKNYSIIEKSIDLVKILECDNCSDFEIRSQIKRAHSHLLQFAGIDRMMQVNSKLLPIEDRNVLSIERLLTAALYGQAMSDQQRSISFDLNLLLTDTLNYIENQMEKENSDT